MLLTPFHFFVISWNCCLDYKLRPWNLQQIVIFNFLYFTNRLTFLQERHLAHKNICHLCPKVFFRTGQGRKLGEPVGSDSVVLEESVVVKRCHLYSFFIEMLQTWHLSTQLCSGERTGRRLLWSTTLLLTTLQPGFHLPRHTWSLINRFRAGQG